MYTVGLFFISDAASDAPPSPFGLQPIRQPGRRVQRITAQLSRLWSAAELQPFLPSPRNYPR